MQDGTEIVFDSNRNTGNWDIWNKPILSGDAIRLTDHPDMDIDPAVSADGSKIAFISFRDNSCDIWMMNYDGTDQEQVTNNDYYKGQMSCSPNGDYLAFTSNQAGNWDIWIISLAGGEIIQFTTDTADDMYPNWSPDGNQIAFSSNRTGNNDIWIKDFTFNTVEEIVPISDIVLRNYPNPFNPATTISFSLTTKITENTELLIYNLKGQKIKQYSIFNNQSSIIWNGTDQSNTSVASGIYFYKLNIPNSPVKRMLLIK